MSDLIVIGGGLAGSEAAYQAALRGVSVKLYEMRPHKLTEAHKTGLLAELVCSNSLRSNMPYSAPGLFKKELLLADSLIMEAAESSKVPAGSALAVDRALFSKYITEKLEKHPGIEIIREEVTELPDSISIMATGPLTSNPLIKELSGILGNENLYFYDAIAPIIDTDTINYDRVFYASRYEKGGNDYINCPLNKNDYDMFYASLIEADRVTAKDFEDKKVFEGCMPIEVMASRGRDTLRYGPLKPVGLNNPKTGKMPYAVVQLRTENNEKTAYNMVGFQTRLKWPDQKRIFRMIPGLENADFFRLGSIHRNTFVNSPLFLNKNLTLKTKENIFLAGQITGVEGYIESTAMGMLAGIYASKKIKGLTIEYPSTFTAHGVLIDYITESKPESFQPSNINFGLFPSLNITIRDKSLKRKKIVERAISDWEKFLERI